MFYKNKSQKNDEIQRRERKTQFLFKTMTTEKKNANRYQINKLQIITFRFDLTNQKPIL